MNTVVFLQNAWSPLYAGRRWPRKSWLRALARSRSGRRLIHLIDDLDLCEETTPEVADNPRDPLPPDPEHIREVLRRRKPYLVIACGNQARDALLDEHHGPFIHVPHPAHRLLTDALYLEVRSTIAKPDWVTRCPWPRFSVLQDKGKTRIEALPGMTDELTDWDDANKLWQAV